MLERARVYSRMIKLSHSVFALPFALAAAALAATQVPVTAGQLALLVVAMVAARSTAMGFNRIADRRIDAVNTRTAGREIPSGQLTVGAAWAFTLASAVLFVASAALLSPLVLALSPVALAVVWGYSLTKRFTALCHLVLGVALGLAPTGVWIALTGSYGPEPLLLSLAVATWVAGFDMLYACQDIEFDRDTGLHSFPATYGLRPALVASGVLHLATVGLLAAMPVYGSLGVAYGVGVGLIAAVLAYEHWIVGLGDLARIDKAFFDLNGAVALLFLGFVLVDVALI